MPIVIMKFGGSCLEDQSAFNKIYEISLNTNYNLFKEERSAINHIKKVTNLLGIEIRTKEKW